MPARLTAGADAVGGDLLDTFAAHVRSFVDVESLAPLRVVADTANGMGGYVLPAVFEPLPLDWELMYGELDGTFPNHPADPIQPENLVDLSERVLSTGADVGLAFDGDADRVFLVDECGRAVSGSLLTALVAQAMLRRSGPGPILHNLICSRAVPEAITEAGGQPLRTRVGHSYIKAEMARTGAAFGGEHSGHYYFADNFGADSGLIAALIALEQLSVASVPLSELLAPLDRYASSGEINTPVADIDEVMRRVSEHFAGLAQDRLDGLTVDGGDWWFNLRPSNTEPLLRLNLEAPDTAAVNERVSEIEDAAGMIAAWIRNRRRAAGSSSTSRTRMWLDPALAQLLACPQDKGPLYFVADEDLLYNPRLARAYAINDGIPVLLIDEASAVDPAAAAALDERIASGELAPTFDQ